MYRVSTVESQKVLREVFSNKSINVIKGRKFAKDCRSLFNMTIFLKKTSKILLRKALRSSLKSFHLKLFKTPCIVLMVYLLIFIFAFSDLVFSLICHQISNLISLV